MVEEEYYLYVVRERDEIVALFPNKQKAIYFCQEQLANLHYQKELWKRCVKLPRSIEAVD